VSFDTITLCVASQRVFIVVSIYFVIDSVRKLLDTTSYTDRRLGVFAVMNIRFAVCWVKTTRGDAKTRAAFVFTKYLTNSIEKSTTSADSR
jgi:hypothetical protein